MQRTQESFHSYSWHQSHDQATVLLLVPYETAEEDVVVVFDHRHLVAGVRGHPPVVKGRLYGHVDIANSMWQLEPRASHLPSRERTTSTTSTTSTQSSFAFVSDTEISSSFAASVDHGFHIDFDDTLSSPALSSPVSLSAEDSTGFPIHQPIRRQSRFTTSHLGSPRPRHTPLSLSSSFSSLESLHTNTGRLLTIHVEKADSVIWPSLVVGPVPENLSTSNSALYPWSSTPAVETQYNMDPTSMVLIALNLFDIRDEKEEAFEYLVRAWHQAHLPAATMRIASHYLPLNSVAADITSDPAHTPTTATSEAPIIAPDTTPIAQYATPPYTDQDAVSNSRETYYLQRLGGREHLAQLYLEVGLLFLEGSASSLLSSSNAGLSSLRTPSLSQMHFRSHAPESSVAGSSIHNGNEIWRRDQEYARRFFDYARSLCPNLDVPLLPTSDPNSDHDSNPSPVASRAESEHQLQMPSIDVLSTEKLEDFQVRRRRKKEGMTAPPSSASVVEERASSTEEDNTWYLYLPGLVGAGTALLVVGFLSLSSWRKGQGS